jgi:integrase
MSVYFQKGRGWRYNFYLNKTRYQSNQSYHTKREAQRAEARRREEIENQTITPNAQTDMAFLMLLERRLDHVRAYNSKRHLDDYVCMARRWATEWGNRPCSQIAQTDIQKFVLKRSAISAYTANKDLRYLRATFNHGMKMTPKWIENNPTDGIRFLPVQKTVKRIPSRADVLKVILAADPDTQDYLYCIRETMARVSEINRLTWDDVDLEERSVILRTRKKRGGHLTPRKVPMTRRLYDVLSARYHSRDKSKPWVFWQTWWDRRGQRHEGPYIRRRFMENLCARVGVPVFQFHALRHFGASMLDHAGVGIGSIQRILGHENRSTTEIYLQSIGEAERKAMEVFEETMDEEKVTHKVTHMEGVKSRA